MIRGQALVEFALVLPIALILMLGVFDIGRAIFLYNGLTNAAREGARMAIVNQDKGAVALRVQATTFAGPVSNLADLDDLVDYRRSNADGTLGAACAPLAVGCIAVVTPTSEWAAITPIIGNLMGPITFQARSELPIELVCPSAVFPTCPKQP
ncbi:MAG: TadE/TadG family type IV pilus assembly protein [Chloroflexota bacterium]